MNFAGTEWYLRWRGLDSEIPQQRALDIEVRRSKEDESAVVSLRSFMVRE